MVSGGRGGKHAYCHKFVNISRPDFKIAENVTVLKSFPCLSNQHDAETMRARKSASYHTAH